MRRCAILVFIALFFTACDRQEPVPTAAGFEAEALVQASPTQSRLSVQADLQAVMTRLNRRLKNQGASYRVHHAEWLAAPESGQVGTLVLAKNRGNKQLSFHFVPNDPRRTWSAPEGITYLFDESDGATNDGLTSRQTEAAIGRAMQTWEGVQCSNVSIAKVEDSDADPDLIDGILGFGSVGQPFADITHAGWVPAGIFGDAVLGITFAFIFVDENGIPTDVNKDGKIDAAFREIYYNDFHPWGINVPFFDVETIALHEAGHGLSQAHFGKIFITRKNGKVHFAPRAVMNAVYSGIQQQLKGTDNGGHCSIWGSWPNQ